MRLTELSHILVSVFTISLAFTMIYANTTEIAEFGGTFVIIIFTVGLGFIVHELSHKYVAIRYGAHATYRAWTLGLMLAIVTSLFGFVFAAPGAVYIYGKRLSKRQDGIISLAGPASNFVLAVLFVLGSLFFPFAHESLGLGARVNFFLGFFNLFPFFPMDGSKVFAWNKSIWAAAFVGMALGMWAL